MIVIKLLTICVDTLWDVKILYMPDLCRLSTGIYDSSAGGMKVKVTSAASRQKHLIAGIGFLLFLLPQQS